MTDDPTFAAWTRLADWLAGVDLVHDGPGDHVYDWPGFLADIRSLMEYCMRRPGATAIRVRAFHTAFGLPQRDLPSADIGDDLAAARLAFQWEEMDELVQAVHHHCLADIADALADVVYVTYGTALTYGIDLDAVLAEVHRSNMTKLQADDTPLLREDGKVLKSELYEPPDIAGVLERQIQARREDPEFQQYLADITQQNVRALERLSDE